MKIQLLILISLILFLLTGCPILDPPVPEDPTLPAITAEGAHTFGCLVDGEVWLRQPGSGISSHPVSASYSQGTLFLNAWRMNDTIFEAFAIVLVDRFYGPDSILIKNFLDDDVSIKYTTRKKDYYADISQPGYFVISTLDTIGNRIVAGKFSFNAVNDEGDRVEIRDGRFDVRL